MTRSLPSSELCISTYRKNARVIFQQYTWLDMTANESRLEWKRKYVPWFQLQVFIPCLLISCLLSGVVLRHTCHRKFLNITLSTSGGAHP